MLSVSRSSPQESSVTNHRRKACRVAYDYSQTRSSRQSRHTSWNRTTISRCERTTTRSCAVTLEETRSRKSRGVGRTLRYTTTRVEEFQNNSDNWHKLTATHDFHSQAFNLDRHQRITTHSGPELHIRGVSRRDMGIYICLASNGVPTSLSRRIHLEVICNTDLVKKNYRFHRIP